LRKHSVVDLVDDDQLLVAIHTRNDSIRSRSRPVASTTSGRPVRNVEKRAMFSPVATTVPKE
jgi:hypothetical protein